jgi:non-lysosomal glucosylceramidase
MVKYFLLSLLFSAILPTQLFSQNSDWPILKHYDQEHLYNIALPVGGIGTGTISLGGIGDLKDWNIMNKPSQGGAVTSSRNTSPFFAIYTKPEGAQAKTRALMGPVALCDYGRHPDGRAVNNHGLPRFREASFDAAYPFGQVNLSDADMPVDVRIKAFNPMIPANVDDSSIPIFILRYKVRNKTNKPLEVSVSGSILNIIDRDGAPGNRNLYKEENGLKGIFMSNEQGNSKKRTWGTMALTTSEKAGISYQTSMSVPKSSRDMFAFWKDFSTDGKLSEKEFEAGDVRRASLAVKKNLAPGETKEFQFYITWHFPNRLGWDSRELVGNYYTTHYSDAWDVVAKTHPRVAELEINTVNFVNAFIDTDLPDVVKEAALFNMSTLRTETCFRTSDGMFYSWEGITDNGGSCWGSCNHVWNYEQTTPFLFGELAKLQRKLELDHATDNQGQMSFRISLPINKADSYKKVAADGQMGAIVKMYRDWQLSGDDELLKKLWPKTKKAMEFSWIKGGWDADRDGVMEGVLHYTLDVENYGPNPQVELWYLCALKATAKMARYLGENDFAVSCEQLYKKGSVWTDKNLFNGEYYEHQIRPWENEESISPVFLVGAGAKDPKNPDYQIGNGCLVDQLVGQYMAHICDFGYLVSEENIKTTLQSIMKYNYKSSLADHFNNNRTYAMGEEAGLIMASFPYGMHKSSEGLPVGELMTGFEYTATNGMLYEGMMDDGLEVIKDIRDRYDGLKRNPFGEIECGRHYARAMTAYGAILALTGFHYSGVEKTMKFKAVEGKYFWANGFTYGTIELKMDKNIFAVKLDVLGGKPLELKTLELSGFGVHSFERVKPLSDELEIIVRKK